MARYRLAPTAVQEAGLLEHCRHARFVWNLALEQGKHWQPGRAAPPGWAEQNRQLTEARAASAWLRAGSVTVQQQALRDVRQARAHWFRGTHRRPTWRRAGRDEGFRQVGMRAGHVCRVGRRTGQVWIPKTGWVRFRWSRPVPAGVTSYRVTRDRAGRWHIAFAAVPEPTPGPGTGDTVGLAQGSSASVALSTGQLWHLPGLSSGEQARLRRLQQQRARTQPGSNRHTRVEADLARLQARLADRRSDWVEQLSTNLARGYDTIRVGHHTGPAGPSARSGMPTTCWRQLVTRLDQKAPGRVATLPLPAAPGSVCPACGQATLEHGASPEVLYCPCCGQTDQADVHAARHLAAGRAVTARGALQPPGGATNREPPPTPPAKTGRHPG